jgi:hypothetical protein
MNKSSFNWVTVLSLGSAFCALIVVLNNATTTHPQLSGVFAITSLLLALIATPLSFKKANQYVAIKTIDNKKNT